MFRSPLLQTLLAQEVEFRQGTIRCHYLQGRYDVSCWKSLHPQHCQLIRSSMEFMNNCMLRDTKDMQKAAGKGNRDCKLLQHGRINCKRVSGSSGHDCEPLSVISLIAKMTLCQILWSFCLVTANALVANQIYEGSVES